MENTRHQVIIIGAGPAGLAVAGQLAKRDVPYLLVEKADNVASSWIGHYDRLCLHTVKEFSSLPDFPFPKDYPTYVPRDLLIAYFNDFMKQWRIKVEFKKELKRIQKDDQFWLVHLKDGTSLSARFIVISTGINRIPNIPLWKNQDLFDGEIVHSRYYKNPEGFKNKKVLVVGMGNTGAEIALDLAQAGIDTYLSVRNQVLIVPRDVLGQPSQVTAQKLAKLPFGWGDSIGNFTRRTLIGNLSKYGIRLNPEAPVKFLKETGNTPVMDLGTVKMIRRGKIIVLPDIIEFTKNDVVDEGGKSTPIDSVILATGYKSRLKDFLPLEGNFFDQNSLPRNPIGTGRYEGLYFLGFDNYQLGGILGCIRRDAPIVAESIDSLLKNDLQR